MGYLNKKGELDTNQFPYRFDSEAVLPIINKMAQFAQNPLGTTGAPLVEGAAKAYWDLPTPYQAKRAEDLRGYVPNPNYVSSAPAPIQNNSPLDPQSAALERIKSKVLSNGPVTLPAPAGTFQEQSTDDIRRIFNYNDGKPLPGTNLADQVRARFPGVKVNGEALPATNTAAQAKPYYDPSGTGDLIRTVLPDGTVKMTNLGTPTAAGPSRPRTFKDELTDQLHNAMRELRFAQTFNSVEPTKEGLERVKNAMAAIQSLGAIINQEATARHTEEQGGKLILGPGQKSWTKGSDGKYLPGPENMEGYMEEKRLNQENKDLNRKMTIGKQASDHIHGLYNAFSKHFDAITDRYPGASEKGPRGELLNPADFKARESELRNAQTNFMGQIGVDDPYLARLPKNEQVFIEEQLGGNKGSKEQIAKIKSVFAKGIAARNLMIDAYLQSKGYHKGNLEYLTANQGQ